MQDNELTLWLSDFESNPKIEKAFEPDIVKAKYIKRIGSPGNYRYIYAQKEQVKSKDAVKIKQTTSFEDILAHPEGRAIIEGIEGLDSNRADHLPLYEDYKKQLKDLFGYDAKYAEFESKLSSAEDHNGDKIKVGDNVQVHRSLTTDPLAKQGQFGKIKQIDSNGTVHVQFGDGKVGMYQSEGLQKMKED